MTCQQRCENWCRISYKNMFCNRRKLRCKFHMSQLNRWCLISMSLMPSFSGRLRSRFIGSSQSCDRLNANWARILHINRQSSLWITLPSSQQPNVFLQLPHCYNPRNTDYINGMCPLDNRNTPNKNRQHKATTCLASRKTTTLTTYLAQLEKLVITWIVIQPSEVLGRR